MLNQSTRYYVPAPSTWPIFGSCALLSMALGAAFWFNGVGGAGPFVFAVLLVLPTCWWVRSGPSRTSPRAGMLQQAGRHLVPLGHGVVHLLRGDVLRRVLRRAVLRAPVSRCRGSGEGDKSTHAAVAGLHRRAGRVGPVRHRSGSSSRWPAWGMPLINTADPADLGRHGDDRAPCAAAPAPRAAAAVPRR